jgi:hypothetical protein
MLYRPIQDQERPFTVILAIDDLPAKEVYNGHVEAVPLSANPFPSRTNNMPDLKDGETAEVKGSARTPYILKNVGGVYSCSCPAWRNQSVSIERRTCKHLRVMPS